MPRGLYVFIAGVIVVATSGVAAVGSMPTAAAQPVATVTVDNNFFDPKDAHVDRGGTITWVVKHDGHTITADDGRFDFRDTKTGDSRSFSVGPNDEAIGYHCLIHGQPTSKWPNCDMCGFILVGAATVPNGSQPPPPTNIRNVPSGYPTITAALTGAPSGTVVTVASGVYHESIAVDAPGVTVRGATDGTTVLDGDTTRTTGVDITADDARIESLTVRNFAGNAIAVGRVNRFAIAHVVALNNGRHGFFVRGASGGAITSSSASGNSAGYWVANSRAIELSRSVARDNATGVVVSGNSVLHAWTNTIDSNNRYAPNVMRDGEAGPVSGVGILVLQGMQDQIDNNTITGHRRFGIVVSALTGLPSGVRITDNTVSESSAPVADVAWDGLGTDVCFSDNRATTFDPSTLQALSSCNSSPSVGIPEPVVDVALLSDP